MSEAELKLVTDAKNSTMYTIQFLSDDDSEFEKSSHSRTLTD